MAIMATATRIERLRQLRTHLPARTLALAGAARVVCGARILWVFRLLSGVKWNCTHRSIVRFIWCFGCQFSGHEKVGGSNGSNSVNCTLNYGKLHEPIGQNVAGRRFLGVSRPNFMHGWQMTLLGSSFLFSFWLGQRDYLHFSRLICRIQSVRMGIIVFISVGLKSCGGVVKRDFFGVDCYFLARKLGIGRKEGLLSLHS